MTARRGIPSAEGARAGTPRHVPVLLPQVLAALTPQSGDRIVDATFGAGGYSAAILAAAPQSRILGIDRDPSAIAAGQSLANASSGRLLLARGEFANLDDIAAAAHFAPANGVVLDVGVSSMQLDDPARGFSFQSDGPLDMRMSGTGETAAEVVNTADQEELADILFFLGEERSARAVARRIVALREQRQFALTSDLAELVARVLGREKIAGRHAATRSFQALRIYVNDELGQLARGLAAAERVLGPGGRLVIVTFHSLEDRLVKRFLKERSLAEERTSRHLPPTAGPLPPPSFRFVNPRPVSPTLEEIVSNPRARSAKLRSAIRTDAPGWPGMQTVLRSRGLQD